MVLSLPQIRLERLLTWLTRLVAENVPLAGNLNYRQVELTYSFTAFELIFGDDKISKTVRPAVYTKAFCSLP